MPLPTAPTQALKIFRETSLPGSLETYSIYMIAPAARPDYVEMYVTGATTGTVKRVINQSDINLMVSDAIAAANELKIVADIYARNQYIAPGTTSTTARYAYVISASTGSNGLFDSTVSSGGATYLYNPAVGYTSWIKISEAESMDMSVDWAYINNKPTSSVADIDDAVSKRHSHTNKTELDKIGEDANGLFTYNGVLPLTGWQSTTW
jgi:hypothetical protein